MTQVIEAEPGNTNPVNFGSFLSTLKIPKFLVFRRGKIGRLSGMGGWPVNSSKA